VVDQDAMGYGPGDSITLTCPDRSLIVQRNRFGVARSSVPGNKVWQEIQRLVEGAWPNAVFPFPGWSQLDTSASAKVPALHRRTSRKPHNPAAMKARLVKAFVGSAQSSGPVRSQ